MKTTSLSQTLWEVRLAVLSLANSPSLVLRTTGRILRRILLRPLQAALRDNPLVRGRVWGASLYMPADHPLAETVSANPFWSHPIIDAVRALELSHFQVVDVGANIGDTVALLESSFPGMGKYLCIEPDDSFHLCCHLNTKANDRVTLVKGFAGDTGPSRVVISHDRPGTATTRVVPDAVPVANAERPLALDELCASLSRLDLLKIDTDGFEFGVLRSAVRTLRKHRPLILFEWAPPLWEAQREDSLGVFDFLGENGYAFFAFFADSGLFYASTLGVDNGVLESLRLAVSARSLIDNLYFDVLTGPVELCKRAIHLNVEATRTLCHKVPAWTRLKPAHWYQQ